METVAGVVLILKVEPGQYDARCDLHATIARNACRDFRSEVQFESQTILTIYQST